MASFVIPAPIHTTNHPYPSLKRRGCSNVIPAAFSPDGHREGIQGYKTLAILVAGACLSLLLSITPALAATAPAPQNTGVPPAGRDVLKFLGDTAERAGLTADADADTTDVYDIIAAIINTVLGLTGIIFFIQVFWAGFRWMTAGGAEETITTAKKTITSSVIGIVIALSAFVITNFVLNKIEDINRGTIDVSSPSAGTPATQSPVTTSNQTQSPESTLSGTDTGWCQARIAVGEPAALGQPATRDQWGACHEATQNDCKNEALDDPESGGQLFSWGADRASTCTH